MTALQEQPWLPFGDDASGADSGASSDGSGGAAAAPPLRLLPRSDRHTLLRLMSDDNYQQAKLGSAFKPPKKLRSGRFWCLAAAYLEQPLAVVMLTGMSLREGGLASSLMQPPPLLSPPAIQMQAYAPRSTDCLLHLPVP